MQRSPTTGVLVSDCETWRRFSGTLLLSTDPGEGEHPPVEVAAHHVGVEDARLGEQGRHHAQCAPPTQFIVAIKSMNKYFSS